MKGKVQKAIEVVCKTGEIIKKVWDGETKLYDEMGREIPDPTPVRVNIPQKGTQQRIADLVKGAVSRAMEERGGETWEQANDFDIDPEDPDGFIYPDDYSPNERIVRKDGFIEETPAEPEKKIPQVKEAKEAVKTPA